MLLSKENIQAMRDKMEAWTPEEKAQHEEENRIGWEKWEADKDRRQLEALTIYWVKRFKRMGVPVVSADKGLIILDFAQTEYQVA